MTTITNNIPDNELSRVMELLPRGSERLITASEISQITGISKRTIYHDIALLIDRYSVPIGGLRSEGQHGYFIITTEEERKQALASLQKHTNEMQKRINKVTNIEL